MIEEPDEDRGPVPCRRARSRRRGACCSTSSASRRACRAPSSRRSRATSTAAWSRSRSGPITAQYKGAARIIEADEDARRIVLKGEGRDTRGQGNASATVTVLLAPDGAGTQVTVDTDLNVTGKVAQFGRGVMADVSAQAARPVRGLPRVQRPERRRLGRRVRRRDRRRRRRRGAPSGRGGDGAGGRIGGEPPNDGVRGSTAPRPSPSISWTRPAVRWRSAWCRCSPASPSSPSSSGCSAARSPDAFARPRVGRPRG